MANARLVFVAAALAALVAAPHAAARPAPADPAPGFIDAPEDCLEAAPEQYSLYGVDDDGQEVVLDVHFVLDDVPPSDAQVIVERASKPYGPVGIRINATYEDVHFEPTGRTAAGVPTIDAQELIDATRDHFGGYRPHHTDVVYTMTSKELVSSGAAGDAVAGMADCIGGIRYPEAAFAVGEVDLAAQPPGRWSGKVGGHEIAHLLGAHHHYANCAEGDTEEMTTHGTPCTLMFNDTFLISLKFSTLEGAVVRGHALEYATKTPAGPPPAAERTIEVERVRRWLGGTLSSEGPAACSELAALEVQRKAGRQWAAYETIQTDAYADFEIKIQDGGEFRVVAPAFDAHDGKSWRTCTESVSSTIRF